MTKHPLRPEQQKDEKSQMNPGYSLRGSEARMPSFRPSSVEQQSVSRGSYEGPAPLAPVQPDWLLGERERLQTPAPVGQPERNLPLFQLADKNRVYASTGSHASQHGVGMTSSVNHASTNPSSRQASQGFARRSQSQAGRGVGVGSIIADRYSLDSMLAAGSTGQIYLARDLQNHHLYALKVLHPWLANQPGVIDLFTYEFLRMKRLEHPGIVKAYLMERDPTHKVWFVLMEYVEGGSLEQFLQPNVAAGEEANSEPLSFERVLYTFARLTPVLRFLHERRIVHRDLKPSHLLWTAPKGQGNVKLIGFGLSASLAEVCQSSLALGQVGVSFYTAPERMMSGMQATVATDVFSLGVILYQMLTGRLPIGMAEMPSALFPDYPPMLDKVLRRALDPRWENRFPTVDDLMSAFKQAVSSRVLRTGRTGSSQQAVPPSKLRSSETPTSASLPASTQKSPHQPPVVSKRPSASTHTTAHSPSLPQQPLSDSSTLLYSSGRKHRTGQMPAQEPPNPPAREERSAKADSMSAVLSSFKKSSQIRVRSQAPLSPMERSDRWELPSEEDIERERKKRTTRPPMASDIIPPTQRKDGQEKKRPTTRSAPLQQEPQRGAPSFSPAAKEAVSELNSPRSAPATPPPSRLKAPTTEEFSPVSNAQRLNKLRQRLSNRMSQHTQRPQTRTTSKPSFSRTLETQQGVLTALAFSPDGAFLASASEDSTIKLWEVSSWYSLHTIQMEGQGIEEIAWAPDSKWLAYSDVYGHVVIRDVMNPDHFHSFSTHTTCLGLAWSADGQTLWAAGADGMLRVWEMASFYLPRALPLHNGRIWDVCHPTPAISQEPNHLITAGDDGVLALWDLRTERPVYLFHEDGKGILCVAPHPVDAMLISGNAQGEIQYWETQFEGQTRSWRAHNKPIRHLKMSHHGQWFLTADDSNTVYMWRTNDGELLTTFSTERTPIRTIALDPDNRWLALVDHTDQIVLWDVSSWNP